MGVLHDPARRLHGARHLVHRRHARHRQQHHRHRQCVRAGDAGAAPADLRQGQGPGGALHDNPIFRTPFFFYAPLTFAAPMLGAAQGAYAHFREWTKPRKAVDGSAVAEKTAVQVQMARAAADLDAAGTAAAPHHADARHAARGGAARCWRARSAISRGSSEMSVAAIDTLMTLERHGGFCQLAADPARLARHPLRLDPCQPQPRDQLRAFRPHRVWPAARSEPAVLLTRRRCSITRLHRRKSPTMLGGIFT